MVAGQSLHLALPWIAECGGGWDIIIHLVDDMNNRVRLADDLYLDVDIEGDICVAPSEEGTPPPVPEPEVVEEPEPESVIELPTDISRVSYSSYSGDNAKISAFYDYYLEIFANYDEINNFMRSSPSYAQALFFQQHLVPLLTSVDDPNSVIIILHDDLWQQRGVANTFEQQTTRYNSDGSDSDAWIIATTNQHAQYNFTEDYVDEIHDNVQQGMSIQTAFNLVYDYSVSYLEQYNHPTTYQNPSPLNEPEPAEPVLPGQISLEDILIGSPSAPIQIIAYADFLDEMYKSWFVNTRPLIIQNYVDTGYVSMTFSDMSWLASNSPLAAQATYCAHDQGRYWDYHSGLINLQGTNFDWANTSQLLSLASSLGLSTFDFNECMMGTKYEQFVYDNNQHALENLGITGSPHFRIIYQSNGTIQTIHGAQSYSTFQSVIDPSSTMSATVTMALGSSMPGCEETAEGCFIPTTVTITAGGYVEWENTDNMMHFATSGDGATNTPDGVFDSGMMNPGQSWSYTFDEAGSYDYYCMVHPWMVGTVIVE